MTHYQQPTDLQMVLSAGGQAAALSNAVLIIPMCETEPSVVNLLRLHRTLPTLIINDRSSIEAVEAVHQLGVPMFNRDDVYECVNTERILDLLGMNNLPNGKGMTVLAGYLIAWARAQTKGVSNSYLIQHDAELPVSNYSNVEYLAYLWSRHPEAPYVKIAKGGRNNETVMNMIVQLDTLADLMETSLPKVADRAKALGGALREYKWPLTGQFGLSWEAARQRPFSSGYGEEILTNVFAADLRLGLYQVANKHPVMDKANSYAKEQRMMQIISSLLLHLVFSKPLAEWSESHYREINQRLSQEVQLTLIPDAHHGPNEQVGTQNDRLLPSIQQLLDWGYVYTNKLCKLYGDMQFART